MSDPSGTYSSYLLRLWQDAGRCRPVYRASLESAQTGERVGFESLDALCGFLKTVAERGKGQMDVARPVGEAVD